jgi:hypothetical protein
MLCPKREDDLLGARGHQQAIRVDAVRDDRAAIAKRAEIVRSLDRQPVSDDDPGTPMEHLSEHGAV